MNLSNHYRKRATELAAEMRCKKDPAARVERLQMAKAYQSLAELADRNARLDVVYGPATRLVKEIQPEPKDKEKM